MLSDSVGVFAPSLSHPTFWGGGVMLKRFLCLLTALLLLPAACFAQEFVMAGFDGQDSIKD